MGPDLRFRPNTYLEFSRCHVLPGRCNASAEFGHLGCDRRAGRLAVGVVTACYALSQLATLLFRKCMVRRVKAALFRRRLQCCLLQVFDLGLLQRRLLPLDLLRRQSGLHFLGRSGLLLQLGGLLLFGDLLLSSVGFGGSGLLRLGLDGALDWATGLAYGLLRASGGDEQTGSVAEGADAEAGLGRGSCNGSETRLERSAQSGGDLAADHRGRDGGVYCGDCCDCKRQALCGR